MCSVGNIEEQSEVTYEYNEVVRIQFFVVTDGQDQFESMLKQYLNTVEMYGQEPPILSSSQLIILSLIRHSS